MPERGELPMRRLTHWQRKLIGLVATLVILSALLGDTEATHAAPAVSELNQAIAETMGCGAGFARLLPSTSSVVWGLTQETAGSQEHVADRTKRALAGVPPWVIWPPSPVPRVAGALLPPPAARNRLPVSIALAVDGGALPDLIGLLSGRTGLPVTWPEPFCPNDRLPGASQQFPRPPPG
jgi:hypothetical protein